MKQKPTNDMLGRWVFIAFFFTHLVSINYFFVAPANDFTNPIWAFVIYSFLFIKNFNEERGQDYSQTMTIAYQISRIPVFAACLAIVLYFLRLDSANVNNLYPTAMMVVGGILYGGTASLSGLVAAALVERSKSRQEFRPKAQNDAVKADTADVSAALGQKFACAKSWVLTDTAAESLLAPEDIEFMDGHQANHWE